MRASSFALFSAPTRLSMCSRRLFFRWSLLRYRSRHRLRIIHSHHRCRRSRGIERARPVRGRSSVESELEPNRDDRCPSWRISRQVQLARPLDTEDRRDVSAS